ncbi:MAG: hypothetical protein IJT77_08300 [Clostridia bacterium]|nr:hypothetical protein [Clostridia bacterium]
MFSSKKRLGLFILVLMLLTAAVASAVEYPVYACCTGTKVNVRKSPDEMYPSRGQLIKRAPITVLGEEGTAYLCDTWVGQGYVPKQYVQLFEGMTAEEFAVYKSEHPNEYRKEPRYPWCGDNENGWLLEMYNAGKISKQELLHRWYCEPCTGYTGLEERSDGTMHAFRRWWW